jgi:hypothetical protein
MIGMLLFIRARCVRLDVHLQVNTSSTSFNVQATAGVITADTQTI